MEWDILNIYRFLIILINFMGSNENTIISIIKNRIDWIKRIGLKAIQFSSLNVINTFSYLPVWLDLKRKQRN